MHILSERSYAEISESDVRPDKIIRLFGKNSPYFIGIHCLNAGLDKQAIALFEAGKKSAEPFARLSFERLTEIGSATERLSAAEKYYKQYPSNVKAKLCLAELLYENQKYSRAVNTVELSMMPEISIKIQNQLTKIRILSLMQQQDERFLQHLRVWYTQFDMSASHSEFFRAFNGYFPSETIKNTYGEELLQLEAIMSMRHATYMERNYVKALSFFEQITEPLSQLPAPLLSDIGKAHLYGGKDFLQSARLFEAAAQKMRDESGRFIAYFYAGRLSERAANYDAALAFFLQAMNIAPTNENYDNALWYYFDTISKKSVLDIPSALKTYASKWHNPAYFDDFLDTSSYALLSRSLWSEFAAASVAILPYAGGESAAKYSYITARLLQEKLITVPPTAENAETYIQQMLTGAYSGDHVNFYYRFLAADRLSVPLEDLSMSLLRRRKNAEFTPDAPTEQLLRAYAQFGLPDLIYAEYIQNPRAVSTQTAAELAAIVARAGKKIPQCYPQSLRIIAAAAAYTDVPITREILELLYPRPYLTETEAASTRFEIPPYVLFGLIRSESFFDKDIVSHAGAIGLAQLMKPTAADIAARLKIREYDLLDADTNITFGAWYLANMLSRLDNSPLLALFAYNGGITRVRNWVKSSGTLPRDLFLETLPFTETREYGRKVLAASAIYGYLYYNKNPHEIVQEIMR